MYLMCMNWRIEHHTIILVSWIETFIFIKGVDIQMKLMK